MTFETMLEQNRRDLMRQFRYMRHTLAALEAIDPLPGHSEAGVLMIHDCAPHFIRPEHIVIASDLATQPNAPVSADLFAPAIQSMPPASENPANAAQWPAYGYAPGYEPSNWNWPGMPEPVSVLGHGAPLLSRASCVEVEPESNGTKLAAEIRQACNNLTEEEQEEALKHGMRLIYGGEPKPWKRTWSLKKTDENGYESEYYREDPRLYGIQSNAPGWSGWLVDEDGLYRTNKPQTAGRHRFIYSNGTERKERAAQ
jgi:hypothetical protein